MARSRSPLTVLAVVAPLVAAVAAAPLRARVPSADVAAVLVGVVALAGSVGSRASPVLSALSAAVAFDVLWAEPYGSLQVRDPGDRLTGVVMFVVGTLVASFCRRRHGVLRRWLLRRRPRRGPTQHLDTVSRVAEDIADGDDAGLVVLDVARTLVEVLALKDCWFEVPPLTGAPKAVLVHGGELELGGTRWDPGLIGLPDDGFHVPVVARGRVEGRFVCVPRRRQPVPRECILVALTLADQTASALLLASGV